MSSLMPASDPSPREQDAAFFEPQSHRTNRTSRALAILLGIAFAFAIGEGIYAWKLSTRLTEAEQSLQAQLRDQDHTLQQLRERMGITEEEFSNFQGDLVSARDNLTKTVGELRRTQQLAGQLQKQHAETAGQLSTQLAQLQQEQAGTKNSIGTLSTDVSGVRQDVGAAKQELATTRTQLQRVIGDLGAQSDLVARNRQDLAELRARGERDYFEFDLSKSKQASPLGPVALQLKNADVKRQKYTITLRADDRTIEKKDKTVNEPVQFYRQGQRQATEIVVNQVYKNRIVGYISVPKQVKMSGTENPGDRSGS
jgi:chromosome segregation ATPase